MKPTEVHRAQLLRCAGFSTLTADEVDAFLLFARERRLLNDEYLFRQGAPGDFLAVVFEGALSVRLERPDGEHLEISRVDAAQMIGEMACLDPAPRSASAVALCPTWLIEFDREGLDTLVRELPRVASAVVAEAISNINRRLGEVDQQIKRALAGSAPSQRPFENAAFTAAPESRSAWQRFLDRLRGEG